MLMIKDQKSFSIRDLIPTIWYCQEFQYYLGIPSTVWGYTAKSTLGVRVNNFREISKLIRRLVSRKAFVTTTYTHCTCTTEIWRPNSTSLFSLLVCIQDTTLVVSEAKTNMSEGTSNAIKKRRLTRNTSGINAAIVARPDENTPLDMESFRAELSRLREHVEKLENANKASRRSASGHHNSTRATQVISDYDSLSPVKSEHGSSSSGGLYYA